MHCPEKKICWRVTRRCNLSCQHCLAGHENLVHGELTRKERRLVVDLLATLGLSRVTWSGGEPTLCPDVPHLVSRLQQEKVRNTITTHGLNLHDNLLNTIRDTEDCLRVSFDGLESTHNRIRRAQVFGRSFSNLQRAIGTGVRVEVNLSAMRDNVADLPALAAMLAKEGVSTIVVMALLLRESAVDNSLAQLSGTELEQLKYDLREVLRPFPHVGLRVNDYQQANDRYIILESDGTIVISSDTKGDRRMGAILGSNGLELLRQALDEQTLEHQQHIVQARLGGAK